jgi:FKBP-type peptidyl-prolyl cis-trans isomerase
MNIPYRSTMACLLGGFALIGTTPFSSSAPLASEKEKISYAIGRDIGGNFKSQNLDVDISSLSQGISDELQGKGLPIPEDELKATMQKFMQERQAAAAAQRKESSAAAVKKGAAFAEQFKKEKGVVTTKSGLAYRMDKVGEGKCPGPTSTVVAHYRGTLVDGTEFDSSYKRGQPISFPLNQVIPGWTEGVQLMKAGGKATFVIPPELAYGDRGSPPAIGPGETLKFEIELVSFQP